MQKTKCFVTLSWILNEVKVKMKGMLHIYNDCTIDWHISMYKYMKRFGLSRVHKVTPVFGMDARTDMIPMSPVRDIRPAGDN